MDGIKQFSSLVHYACAGAIGASVDTSPRVTASSFSIELNTRFSRVGERAILFKKKKLDVQITFMNK